MRVKVLKRDIEAGRRDAKERCGCPLWHALARRLGLKDLPIDTSVLEFRNYAFALLGNKLKIKIPKAAIEFQKILVAAPQAQVKPFEFEAELELKGA